MHTILIIDDDTSICETLSTYLAEEGYRVLTAGTGAKGISEFSSGMIDLVLLDIRLPDMDGFTVMKNLRKEKRDVKVIMVSAFHDMSSLIKAMAAGACKCVGKPINIHELELAIENALN
jgi:DNA-binding response OmpR family regulator